MMARADWRGRGLEEGGVEEFIKTYPMWVILGATAAFAFFRIAGVPKRVLTAIAVVLIVILALSLTRGQS